MINILFILTFLLFNYSYIIFGFTSGNHLEVVETKKNYIVLKDKFTKYYLRDNGDKYTIGEYLKIIGDIKEINYSIDDDWNFNFSKFLDESNIKFEIFNFQISHLHNFSIKKNFYNFIGNSHDLTKLFLGQQKNDSTIYSDSIELGLTYILNITAGIFYLFIFPLKYIKNKKLKKILFITFLLLIFFYVYLLNFKIIILKFFLLLLFKYLKDLKSLNIGKKTKWSLIIIIELFFNPYFCFNLSFYYINIAYIFLNYEKNNVLKWKIAIDYLKVNLIFLPMQAFFDYKFFWIGEIQKILLIPLITLTFVMVFYLNWFPIFNSFFDIIENIISSLTSFFVKTNLITNCGKFSIFFLILYFLLLYIAFKIYHYTDIKRYFISVGVTINFLIMLTINIFLNTYTITMLNVGNGNSFVLKTFNKIYIFDAGAAYGKSDSILKNYLTYSGVNKIDSIYISHNHLDHYSQLDKVVDNFDVKHLYNWDHRAKLYQESNFNIYNFQHINNKDENDNSKVLIFNLKNKRIIFTGDLTKEIEGELIKEKEFISTIGSGIDFLQVGHHGSKTSTGTYWLSLLRPKTCYILGTKTKQYNFPAPETMQNLNKSQCSTYVTNSLNSYKYYINSGKTKRI